GAEVLDHDVRLGGEAQEDRRTLRVREVEGHEPLVPAERLEPQTDAVLVRPVPARRVGPGRMLDLGHLGAEVPEVHGREGRCEERRRLEHANAFKWTRHDWRGSPKRGEEVELYSSTTRRSGEWSGTVM